MQHSAIGTNILQLESTAASASDSSNRFNATAATSSVFTAGTWWNSDSQGIAYCFAPVEGFSSFGSYEGNGSSDGPFVALSFQPALVMVKNIDNYGGLYSWWIFDSTRDPSNPVNATLKADGSDNESSEGWLDILSNGFKIRASSSAVNLNAHTHVYAAWAQHPFKTARAR